MVSGWLSLLKSVVLRGSKKAFIIQTFVGRCSARYHPLHQGFGGI